MASGTNQGVIAKRVVTGTMSDGPAKGGKTGAPSDERRKRLADQLRRNLRRRKATPGGESTNPGRANEKTDRTKETAGDDTDEFGSP